MVIREKKGFLYLERQDSERKEFLENIGNFSRHKIIYLDESGFDSREKYEYCWSKIGEKILDDRKGKRSKRINMISALNADGNLFAPFVFEGSCDTDTFNTYFSEVLLPKIDKGSVIVMDNASFHKSPVLHHLAEKKDSKIIYLPPYSPDLNPIEQYWAPIKNDLKKRFREAVLDPFETVVSVLKARSI